MNGRELSGMAGSLAMAMLIVLSGVPAAQARAQAQAGDVAASLPKFEVASIRLVEDFDKLPENKQSSYTSPPGAVQFTVTNIDFAGLISMAFGIDCAFQLAGTPAWFNEARYDIAAKPEGDVGLSYEQLRPLLQQLLQERFHLSYHREIKNFQGYALVIAKGGPKLQPSKSDFGLARYWRGEVQGQKESVKTLASMLGRLSKKPVADQTGLKGTYDFELRYAPLEDTDSTLPSIFTAVQEQLGLKLEKQMVPMEMFVIDRVDRVPTEN